MGTAEPPHMVKTLFLSRDVHSKETSTCQPWYLNLPLYHLAIFPFVKFKLSQVIALGRHEIWSMRGGFSYF